MIQFLFIFWIKLLLGISFQNESVNQLGIKTVEYNNNQFLFTNSKLIGDSIISQKYNSNELNHEINIISYKSILNIDLFVRNFELELVDIKKKNKSIEYFVRISPDRKEWIINSLIPDKSNGIMVIKVQHFYLESIENNKNNFTIYTYTKTEDYKNIDKIQQYIDVYFKSMISMKKPSTTLNK